MKKRIALMFLLVSQLFYGVSFAAPTRIKDLVMLRGTGSNKLVGYGLVVGLAATGDRNKGITDVTIANLLKTLGNLTVNASTVRTQDAAAVIVTADLPPYAKPGDTIDGVVSALGDATSLQGGTLMLTPLRGVDGKTYGMAQGPLSIGGFNFQGGGGGGKQQIQQNHPLVGRIPQGVLINEALNSNMLDMSSMTLILQHPDFSTASRIVEAINRRMGPIAEASDAATVHLSLPPEYRGHPVEFMDKVGQVEIIPDEIAKVVINERTGTVVMGKNVTLSPVAIAHGGLTITVKTKPVFAPTPQVNVQVNTRQQTAAQQTELQVEEKSNHLVYIKDSATLRDVVDALNTLGVTPRDLISILQALKEAGALQADLVIL